MKRFDDTDVGRRMTRRGFLFSAAAGAFMCSAAGCRAFAAARTARLRLGVMSDIHFYLPPEYMKPEFWPPNETYQKHPEVLRKALKWFDAEKCDGVVMAGDLAEHGLVPELVWIGDIWRETFPDDTRSDGEHIEKLFVYGNHDMFNKEWQDKHFGGVEQIGPDPAGAWERAFGEKFVPFWTKTVKGYGFIGAHWNPDDGVGSVLFNTPPKTRKVAEYIEKACAGFDPLKPFFYIQHPHPRNTCYGPNAWGHDYGLTTETLSRHPNAVALSGHSHYPLTDETSIWQGAFTSIGTGAFPAIDPRKGRENGHMDPVVPQMPLMRDALRHALLVTVYDDAMIVERREITTGNRLGPDWIVPLGGERPYSFEKRGGELPPPEFAPGAKVSATKVFKGKDRKGAEKDQVVFSWPAAVPGDPSSRAYDYEITVSSAWEDISLVLSQKRVYSPTYYRPENLDRGEVSCTFAVDEILADRPLKVSVVAANSYGRTSRPLVSELTVAR